MSKEIDRDNFDKIDVVKKYFSKEFSILSGEIRERLKSIEIPKKEKEELLRELAFLTKKRQREIIEYLELFQENLTKL